MTSVGIKNLTTDITSEFDKSFVGDMVNTVSNWVIYRGKLNFAASDFAPGVHRS